MTLGEKLIVCSILLANTLLQQTDFLRSGLVR